MQPYYDDGSCVIFHGDCREVLGGLTADLVIADPPYGIGLDTDYTKAGEGTRRFPGRSYAPIVGDDRPFDPAPLLRFPKVVLWGANHYADRLPPSSGWLVWDKRKQTRLNFLSDAELAWCSFKTPIRVFRHIWNGPVRDSERGLHLHPTQKPVALMTWIIGQFTSPGDLIVDPYMGSGPVLRAAKDLGRRAVGIEIEERYCEIAAKRLGQEVLSLEGAR